MKHISLVSRSMILAILTTGMIVVGSIFRIWIEMPEQAGTFQTYFGAISYDVILDDPDLAHMVSFGLSGDLTAIWLTVFLLFVLYGIGGYLYERYKERQKKQGGSHASRCET